MLIIDLSASSKLNEIFVSTNAYIVYRKFIYMYEFWSRDLIHMYNLKN